MATLYPSTLDEVDCSLAERLVFNALAEQLDDGYWVFHSVGWQGVGKDGRIRDGEADFVVGHPKRGVLVIEVKGGQIGYSAQRGKWESFSKSLGKMHDIKDPFAQARDSKHILLAQLKRALGTSRYINVGHVVLFPESVLEDAPLGMDKPREIVGDAGNLSAVSSFLGKAFAYWRGQASSKQTALGDDGLQALLDLLGKQLIIRPVMWGKIQREQAAQIQLTKHQFLLLDMLGLQRRALISGCAGSGKTMLATEKAVRLARAGLKVLLTCFNRNLAMMLNEKLAPFIKKHDIEIVHFHGLCRQFAAEAGGVPAKTPENADVYFKETLPEALLMATDSVATRYDAVIVDEGQDFEESWWIPMQSLLNEPDDGILYIFFDNNQKIYDRKLAYPIEQPPYLLTQNCRNTGTIHDRVIEFYKGKQKPEAAGPEGRPVEIMSTDLNLHETLSRVLRKLIVEEKVPPSEIVVLTPQSQKKSKLWDRPLSIPYTLSPTYPADKNQIYCNAIYQFKGLESSVVIIVEPELAPKRVRNALLYVAFSRARNHLILITDDIDLLL